jgi:hypothetical protein
MAGNTSMNARGDGRSPEPMDFEQLLQHEMAIEPSTEFLPRVRERLDAQSSPARWHWRWLLPVGAVAAAGAAFLVANVLTSDRAAAPPAPALAIAQTVPFIEPSFVPASATRDIVTRRAPIAKRVAGAPGPSDMPVMVDVHQRTALARLLGVIRDGKLTSESFANTTPVSLATIRDRVVPVDVAPVTVSPFGGDGVLQRER